MTVTSKYYKTSVMYNFGGNRETAIQRDSEKCVQCGMTRVEHRKRYNRDITVDHIDGLGRNVPSQLKNNNLSNLQTLCLPCHGRKDVQRRGHITIVQGSASPHKNVPRVGKRFKKQLFKVNGEAKTLIEWSREASCKRSTFFQRFYTYGWPLEKCLVAPTQERGF